jgi:hypothetical protein
MAVPVAKCSYYSSHMVTTTMKGTSHSQEQSSSTTHHKTLHQIADMMMHQREFSSNDDDGTGANNNNGDQLPLLPTSIYSDQLKGGTHDAVASLPVYVPPPSIQMGEEQQQDEMIKENSGSSPSSSSEDRKASTTMASPSTTGRSSKMSSSSNNNRSQDRSQRRRRRRKAQEDGVSKRGSVVTSSPSKSRRSSSQGGITAKKGSSDMFTGSHDDAAMARSILASPPTREIYIPLKSSSSSSEHDNDVNDIEEDERDAMSEAKHSFHSLSGVSALTIPTSLETSPEAKSPLMLLRKQISDVLTLTPQTPLPSQLQDCHRPPVLPSRYMSSDDSQSQQDSSLQESPLEKPRGKRNLVKRDVAPTRSVGEITPPRHGKGNLAKPTPPLRKRSNDGLLPTIPPALFRSTTAPASLEEWDLDNNSNSLRKWKLEPRKPRRHSDQTPLQRSSRTYSSSLERKKPERKHSGDSTSRRGRRTVVDDDNDAVSAIESNELQRGRSERPVNAQGRRRSIRSERSRSNSRRSITPQRSKRSPSPSTQSPQPATDALDTLIRERLNSPISPESRRRATRNDSIELAKGLKPKKHRSAFERSLRSPKLTRQPSPSNRSLSPDQVFEPTYNLGASFTRRSNATTRSSNRMLNGKLSPKNSSTNSWSIGTPTTANCTTSLSSYLDDSSGGHMLSSTKSGSQRSRSLSSAGNSLANPQQCRPPMHPLSASLSSKMSNISSSRSLMTMSSASSRPPLASPSTSGHSSRSFSVRSVESSGSSVGSGSSHSNGNNSPPNRECMISTQKQTKNAVVSRHQSPPSPLTESHKAKLSLHALETISPLSLSSPGSAKTMNDRSWRLLRRKFVHDRVQEAVEDGTTLQEEQNKGVKEDEQPSYSPNRVDGA